MALVGIELETLVSESEALTFFIFVASNIKILLLKF